MTETSLTPIGANRFIRYRTYVRAKACWIWSHRTKTIGGVGFIAGAIQYQLASHPEIRLPHEGVLLMGFGAAGVVVGVYNSFAQFFGWKDPQ